MPDLAELCSALGSDLRPALDTDLPDGSITAVHVSELSDPTPFLAGGELLLTTGMPWRLTGLDTTAYVSRLVRGGILGLGVGLGPVHADLPPVLRAACAEHGLALFTVPPPTPFVEISRTYWGLLARSGQEQLSAALGAHRTLVRAAAGGRPAETTAHRLAEVIEGWATVLSPTGEVRAVRPADRERSARAVAAEIDRLRMAAPHASATFPLDADDVVIYPLSSGNRLTGFIAAGCPRPMRPADRQLIVTAAALLAAQDGGEWATAARRRGVHAVLASLILSGEGDVAYRLMQEFDVTGFSDPVQVIAVHPAPSGDDLVEEGVRRFLSHPERPALTAHRGRTALLVLPGGAEPDRLARLHEWLRQDIPEVRVRASGLTTIDEVAWLQQRLCLSVAGMQPGTIFTPARSALPEGETAIDLQPLRDYQRADLVAAVAAYLRARGRWEDAARDLDVHRNTLRYRIGTASRVLAVDLDDPDVAARLWLTLREGGLA